MKPPEPSDYNAFVRSLMIERGDVEHLRREVHSREGTSLGTVVAEYARLAEAMLIRRQIDRFLGEAPDLDGIAALLLTIATTGSLFGLNRAFLLLRDPAEGWIRGHTGIGTLDREEAWRLWGRIHEEGMDFEAILRRSRKDLAPNRQRLAPVLDRLAFPPDSKGAVVDALCAYMPAILQRAGLPEEERWVLDLVGAEQTGVVPLWGRWGHLGDLLVDNFVTGRPLDIAELEVLADFGRPFAAAMERALIIDRYRSKVEELEAAYHRIDTQKELLVKMEKGAEGGRYTAILAHGLRNPLVAMAGHVSTLRERLADPSSSAAAGRLLDELRDLERFVDDFTERVDVENPSMHFWDLNHLVAEVARSFANLNPIDPVRFTVQEGEVPLVRFDYSVLRDALLRLVGLLTAGRGPGASVRVTTEPQDGHVRVLAELDDGRGGGTEDPRREGEVQRLSRFLSRESVGLEAGDGFFVLTLKA